MWKNSCYAKFDWLDIFPEPIQFRVTFRIRIWRHYVIMRKVCLPAASFRNHIHTHKTTLLSWSSNRNAGIPYSSVDKRQLIRTVNIPLNRRCDFWMIKIHLRAWIKWIPKPLLIYILKFCPTPPPSPIKENVFGGVPAINCITMFFFQEYSIFQPVILAQLNLIMPQSKMV